MNAEYDFWDFDENKLNLNYQVTFNMNPFS